MPKIKLSVFSFTVKDLDCAKWPLRVTVVLDEVASVLPRPIFSGQVSDDDCICISNSLFISAGSSRLSLIDFSLRGGIVLHAVAVHVENSRCQSLICPAARVLSTRRPAQLRTHEDQPQFDPFSVIVPTHRGYEPTMLSVFFFPAFFFGPQCIPIVALK